MPRKTRNAKLETRSARAGLTQQREPYWQTLEQGLQLGYYKGKSSSSWFARLRHAGKYTKEKLGLADDFQDSDSLKVLSHSEAYAKALEFAASISGTAGNHAYTVNQALDDYLNNYEASGGKHRHRMESVISRHIRPPLGDYEVRKLTHTQLLEWRNARVQVPRSIRGKEQASNLNDPEELRKRQVTTNRTMTHLKAALNFAYQNGRVANDGVWRRIKPFKNVEAARVRFLTEDESQHLVNAAEPDLRAMIQAGLYTGARYGELANCRVYDFQAEHKTLQLRETKNGKPRYIPLIDEAVQFLQRQTIGKTPDSWLFTHPDGSKWEKSHQTRPMQKTSKLAGITPNANFYVLRHTYASQLAMRGVPSQVIATVLGHSDTRITEKHYAHLQPDYVTDTIRKHLPDLGNFEPDNVTHINKKL